MGTIPTPAQLGVLLAQTLTSIANAQNAAAINTYDQNMTIYTKSYGTNPSTSAPPPPVPPQIVTINSALVEQLELQAPNVTDAQWLEIYSYSTYEPPPPSPPPAPTLPTIVVQPFGPGYPGYFELAPDSPLIPQGTKVNIATVTYVKENLVQFPFAPNGWITAWKQQ
jgi:hypothetical protein